MDFLVLLIATTLVAYGALKPLKAHPGAFYLVGLLVDVLYIASTFFSFPRWLADPLMGVVQKCELALVLFVVVMFIGCLPATSTLCRRMKSVRAELSILAWVLSLGHMAVYLGSYAPRLMGRAAIDGNVAASFAVALVLFGLLTVLGVTSFGFVKRRMASDAWKRLQKLAYLFFGLVFLHLVLMLAPAALHGGLAARESLVVYAAVFGTYLIARIVRAVRDRRSVEVMAPSGALGRELDFDEVALA